MFAFTKISGLPLLAASLFGCMLVSGCAQEPQPASEERSLNSGITIIQSAGEANLNIRQGNPQALVIHADKSTLSRIVTKQEGNTLRIIPKGRWFMNWIRSWIYPESAVSIDITLPQLQKLDLQGSGDVAVNGFNGDQVDLEIRGASDIAFNSRYKKIVTDIQGSGNVRFDDCASDDMIFNIMGSGNIQAKGQAKTLTANIMGSGSLHMKELVTDTANVSIMGSGDVAVLARQAATISVAGSGNVEVYGNPVQRHVNQAGTGSVNFN